MRIAILQSNYIPWIGYFELIRNVDVFVLYEDVQYTKNDWRNRNYLYLHDKINWLTIPVIHKSLHQKFTETEIHNKIWAKKHFDLLYYNFSKNIIFKKNAEELFYLYEQSTNEKYLFKINRLFLKWALTKLGITTEIIYLEKFEPCDDPNETLIKIIKKYPDPFYLSGPAAKSYINESLFKNNNITLEYVNYNKLLYKYLNGLDFLNLQFSILQFLFQQGIN